MGRVLLCEWQLTPCVWGGAADYGDVLPTAAAVLLLTLPVPCPSHLPTHRTYTTASTHCHRYQGFESINYIHTKQGHPYLLGLCEGNYCEVGG